jgi:hypothetical protein
MVEENESFRAIDNFGYLRDAARIAKEQRIPGEN